MKVSSVSLNYSRPNVHKVQFKGKHTYAKWGAAIFGSAATIGAIGGSIIMTGGISAIPILAAYIGVGAGSGALIGHSIDKGSKEFDKKA